MEEPTLPVNSSSKPLLYNPPLCSESQRYVKWLRDINSKDIELVGGKTSSLGEMYKNLTSKGNIILIYDALHTCLNIPTYTSTCTRSVFIQLFFLVFVIIWHYSKETLVHSNN